jgi:3-keto-disaccharide hydrolase
MSVFALAPLIGLAQKSTLGAKPPKGAIVLFNGKDTSKWVSRGDKSPCQWNVVDGYLEVKPGAPDIMTKQDFGDYKLHVEFWLPLMADKTSQGRANSGVYNQGRYEIQVLDSYNNPTYEFGGCGAIYSQKDPDKDAIKPPEQWNTYDITFRAARLDKEGNVTEKPRITVFHNGIKIHDNVEIEGTATTSAITGPQPKVGPILLQDHGCPVRFRNIWIVPMKG